MLEELNHRHAFYFVFVGWTMCLFIAGYFDALAAKRMRKEENEEEKQRNGKRIHH